jgi:hypothetical protein
MDLENNEMMIWEEPSHMMIHGKVTEGYLLLTNKRMAFVQMQETKPSILIRKTTRNVDIWELGIWDIQDLSLMELNKHNHPLIRVRYKEGETFFTFPKLEPRPTLAALIVLLNHARLINKNISMLENIVDNLNSGTLEVGERMPRMVIDQPVRPDESCHQCAKTMLEEETNILSQEIKECLMCPVDE